MRSVLGMKGPHYSSLTFNYKNPKHKLISILRVLTLHIPHCYISLLSTLQPWISV